MKINLLKITTFILSFIIISTPMFAFAQIENPLGKNTTISGFVTSILGYITKIGGVVAVFAFIWSGFLFVQAQGKPDGLKNANTVFLNTCIGVAVLLGAQLIASIIIGTIKGIV